MHHSRIRSEESWRKSLEDKSGIISKHKESFEKILVKANPCLRSF